MKAIRQSTTGYPTAVEFGGECAEIYEPDVRSKTNHGQKRFTQVQAARKRNTLRPASRC